MPRLLASAALLFVAAALVAVTAPPDAAAAAAPAGYPVTGIDVSNHQRTVDWSAVARAGARFAYAKATEGVSFRDLYYERNNDGAKAQGLYFGAYHFGRPDQGPGADQAKFFLDRSKWTPDGLTLPPMLDIEWPWSGSGAPQPCYGLSPEAMVQWIRSFVDVIKSRTGRPAMIYTNINWWNPCTNSSKAFGDTYLFTARYSSTPGEVPPSWSTWTFWQYSNSGALPGDQDVFRGTLAQLAELAGAPRPAVPGGIVGDFDGDGRPDIAGLDLSGNNLYIHRNTSTPGNPSEAGGTFISSGWATVTHLMAADYDHDGKDDILGRQALADTLLVWRSTSTPSRLSLAPFKSFGPGWNALARLAPIADYTGDGRPDIAGLDLTGNSLYIHRNTSTPGNPSEAGGTFISSGWATVTHLMAADYDHDGKDDILGRQALADTLLVWRSTSTPSRITLAPFKSFGPGWNAIGTFAPLADYTGDGRPDIAGLDLTGNNLYINRNTSTPGNPSEAGGTFISSGWATVTHLMAADYDHDGKDDILGRQALADTLLVWRSTSTPSRITLAPFKSFGPGWNALPHLISSAPVARSTLQ